MMEEVAKLGFVHSVKSEKNVLKAPNSY